LFPLYYRESTARKLIAVWRKGYHTKQYFRFNVEHDLQNIGLVEYEEQGAIETTTEMCPHDQAQSLRVRDYVANLRTKQIMCGSILCWFNKRWIFLLILPLARMSLLFQPRVPRG